MILATYPGTHDCMCGGTVDTNRMQRTKTHPVVVVQPYTSVQNAITFRILQMNRLNPGFVPYGLGFVVEHSRILNQ